MMDGQTLMRQRQGKSKASSSACAKGTCRRHHLILATNARMATVRNGLIKAKHACKIALRVASKMEAASVLDQNGAEVLWVRAGHTLSSAGRQQNCCAQGHLHR